MVKKSLESNQMMSSTEKPLSNGVGGQTTHSANEANKLKQSANNYTSEDIVIINSMDNKNNTMRTGSR